MKESIAILWDIENVTPSSNTGFVTGLLEWAGELGRISVARAYGDWTKRELKGISQTLAQNSFEMMHVPMSRKDSADITLITNTIEIMYQYPHIKKIVLVTGDADFRPLLQAMRKHGIETIIICDAKSASEDLLLLADAYKDYRELIPVPGDDEDDEDDEVTVRGGRGGRERDARAGGEGREARDEKPRSKRKALTFEESVELLKEAVQVMVRGKKPTSLGAVKIRMKLLNGNFNERELKYKSWKDFVLAAAKKDQALQLEYGENDIAVGLKAGAGKGGAAVGTMAGSGQGCVDSELGTIKIPEVIRQLLVAVKNCATSKSSENWVPYSMVSQYLIDIGVDIREHNYGRIRTLVEAAEKRGLVETRSEAQHWLVRLSPEGAAYC
jgi:uncharacterized LabA/DUF88 family protein